MGYDLYGLNPSSSKIPDCDFTDEETTKAYFAWQDNTKGAYFRNNVWWWAPLWDYVIKECSDILSVADVTGGGNNGGHKISKTKAKKIASRLRSLEKKGEIESYASTYKNKQRSLPTEKCNVCKGTGTRKEWEGWQSEEKWLKYHKSLENDKSTGYEWAHKCKGCNGCSGKGMVRNWQSNYPFDSENVMNFADFCEHSGGFRIC